MFFQKKTYRQLPDEALMEAIGRRDEAAFAELYDRYGARMYRFFHKMLWRDAARAEDFAQELFLKIIEKPHLYDPARPFCAWIYTLATNLCRNEFRRQNIRDTKTPAPALDWELPPDDLDAGLLERHLRAAIERLDEPHRTCFVLRYQEELSLRDISDIMGAPEGTIKSRLHHALKKVSAELHGWKAEIEN